MKRIIKSLAIAAVSALAFISCSQEQNPVSKDNGIHFTIRTSENPQVKSFIDNNLNGTYTPKWSNGDELAMFVGTISEKSKPTATLTNSNETGLTAKFDGQVTGIEGDGTFKSFAPAKAFATGYSNGNVGITLAETQKPSSLTIDEACDILVAKETSYMADATGEVTIDDLFFKRMFSVVKVMLNGPASLKGQNVSKFSLTAPEGTVLTGRAAIDLTTATIDKWNIDNNSVTATYEADAPVFGGASGLENAVWLVVNPCTVASGAKVVFTGETANYTFSKEVTLSKALTFPASQLAIINLTLAEENCTKKEVPAPASWIATDLADITATDEVVITMAKDESVYALTSAKGTKEAPTAVAVTVENKELAKAPAEDLVWNIANNNGSLTIYPKGQTATWLYTTDSNNGVRVGTNKDNKTFVVDSEYGYLYNTGTKRYIGVYNTNDWRCYTSMHANISGQTLCFYVKGTPKTALETPANLQVSAEKVVSWDAVSGAASYDVTIGTKTFTSETNSYNASALADDYYDVAVVAVPSDKENFKNSAAATLTGAKFGIPTLTTPELKSGAIDGSSITVTWTTDARATAGYNCEIFNGETKVGESQTVKTGSVKFTNLAAATEFVVKVNAIAVEGEKPYAASPIVTLTASTTNDGSLEHPYTATEAIAAIDTNTDLTGKYVKGIVKAAPSFNATYSSLTYDIESGENTLNIYSGKDLGNAGFVGAEDLKAGDEVVVLGDLKLFKDNKTGETTYELDKNNYLISINGKTQIYRGLAVSEPKTAFNVGDTFGLGGKVLQVWRGKENVDVTASANISGYDMSTEGKQTVTVTVGDESVTYEITVNPAGTVPPTTVTKTMDSIVTENSYTISSGSNIGTKQKTLKIDDVVELSSTGGGNTGSFWGTAPDIDWRCYETTNSVVKISAKEGYIIEKVTLTFKGANGGTLNGGDIKSGTEYDVNAQSVSYKIGHTGKKTGQIRITAISVTYKQQ